MCHPNSLVILTYNKKSLYTTRPWKPREVGIKQPWPTTRRCHSLRFILSAGLENSCKYVLRLQLQIQLVAFFVLDYSQDVHMFQQPGFLYAEREREIFQNPVCPGHECAMQGTAAFDDRGTPSFIWFFSRVRMYYPRWQTPSPALPSYSTQDGE